MAQQIPVASAKADYEQTTPHDGRDYRFTFRFNQRDGHWFMSLSDSDGVPIVQGLRITCQLPLLALVRDARRPPGMLIAIDRTAPEGGGFDGSKSLARDPEIADLGARVTLLYFPVAELVELGLRSE